ncbi:MAG: methionyl-tRNA formyltransferase [Eubacterium sp.]|nr:methionyl-tRNA formyltransferase [Eubacterium sp.]
MKIVFMGTSEFASVQLSRLIEDGYEIPLVVTQPDRAGNRGKVTFPAVKVTALEKGLPILQPERIRNNEEFLETLREISPDVIVVASYGRIVPKEILELPAKGCINVHASLLPKLRGASPIQHAILQGDREAGVTIMMMAEGLDTGDMLSKAALEIGTSDYPELTDRLAVLGAQLLSDTLPRYMAGEIVPEKQDDASATVTGIIKKEDGRVDFAAMTAEEIERRLRAFTPWPGIFCDYEGGALKLLAVEVLPVSANALPGAVVRSGKEGLDIACREGVLRVTELQAPGKKRMAAGAFLLGHRIDPGTMLG